MADRGQINSGLTPALSSDYIIARRMSTTLLGDRECIPMAVTDESPNRLPLATSTVRIIDFMGTCSCQRGAIACYLTLLLRHLTLGY